MVGPTRPPNIHAGLLRPSLLHRGGRATSGAGPSMPAPSVNPAGAKPPSVVNLSLYRDGRRLIACTTLQQLFDARRKHPGAVAWVGLYRPSHDDVALLAREFGLHELAVEDAITAHQRPKLERYGDTLFVVLHAARYIDDVEEVEFGELHMFVGPDFVISMRHSESPDLAGVRERMESEPDLLALGPEAILYAILDRVVDGYGPVVAGLENDIDEIETEIFSGDAAVSRRIYELSREVIEFRRATHPLNTMLQGLQDGFDKYEVRRRDAPLPARRGRPQPAGLRPGRRFQPDPARHAHRERDPRGPEAERGDAGPDRGQPRPGHRGQEDLLLGCDPVRADPDRHDLRDELRPNARPGIPERIHHRDGTHGRHLLGPVRRVQATRLAVRRGGYPPATSASRQSLYNFLAVLPDCLPP